MPCVSIIIPVYNVQAYLHRCVDSLLTQSYDDIDLILVDDGSSDESPLICDEYQSQDKRVHVIHQRNSGAAAARNAGIAWAMKNSESQWIAFVDSDDWVHVDYLKRMISTSEEDDEIDIVTCDYTDSLCEKDKCLSGGGTDCNRHSFAVRM